MYRDQSNASVGGNVVTTLVACPALLQAPSSLLLTQWRELYDRGLKVVVPLALISAASFGYLAYETYRSEGTSGSKFRMYVAATAATISYGPFTRLVMGNCIDRLMELGEMGAKASGDEIRMQVETWTSLNGIRGALIGVGAGIGAWAASVSL